MVSFNVKYVIATRTYDFFYYTQNLIGNITLFDGYYTCSFSKLRYKAHQKVCYSTRIPRIKGVLRDTAYNTFNRQSCP